MRGKKIKSMTSKELLVLINQDRKLLKEKELSYSELMETIKNEFGESKEQLTLKQTINILILKDNIYRKRALNILALVENL